MLFLLCLLYLYLLLLSLHATATSYICCTASMLQNKNLLTPASLPAIYALLFFMPALSSILYYILFLTCCAQKKNTLENLREDGVSDMPSFLHAFCLLCLLGLVMPSAYHAFLLFFATVCHGLSLCICCALCGSSVGVDNLCTLVLYVA